MIGVGMTPFTKPGESLSIDYHDLASAAVKQALSDSKITYDLIQFAAAGYVFGDSTCGQRSLYTVGMSGIPIVNVNNNCSTGSTALYVAANAIRTGEVCCSLAVGFEKMEKGALGSKFKDRAVPMDKHVELLMELQGLAPSPITAQLFAGAGKEHMQRYGTTEQHFAKIAVKNHQHAKNNPNAQLSKEEISLEKVTSSPAVFDFLTRYQCCPTSNGAACAILANEEFVRQHKLQSQAVEILALEMSTDFKSTFEAKCPLKLVGFDMTKAAAEAAFRKAKLKPDDVDVVELHDCFSCNELITYEALGLCPIGHGKDLVDRGDNTYGGKFVINPSGGLLAKGHPLGATGVAQCAELCWQLRGLAEKRQVPNARVALQHNIGLGGAVVVGIYRMMSDQPSASHKSRNTNFIFNFISKL